MKVVCVGDCGVDRYVSLGVDRAGGITLNVAVHLRQCLPDASVTVCSPLGNDAGARIVTETIVQARLEARIRHLQGKTPVQYIDLEPNGEKRFLEYNAGVLHDYRLGPEESAIIGASELLVTTVFAQVEALFDSVMAIPSRGLRAVDFTNLSDVADGVGLVSQYVDRLDVAFFGLASDQVSLFGTLEEIARSSGRLFVVTLGCDGSMALGGPHRIVQRARSVPAVVDTTGAGDSFAAAFLAEYCATRDIVRSLARGSDKAAGTIQHIGGFTLGAGDRRSLH
jgi:fructoselysine 6-kinase